MSKNTVSAIIVAMLLTSTLAFNIRQVKASGTIYIRADGSIDPPDAPISSVDNVTYAFTDHIYDEIVVERSHIIIDGNRHTLQSSGGGWGFYLNDINNVTIQNTSIIDFYFCIVLRSASFIMISRNTISTNGVGVMLESSSFNTICGNNINETSRVHPASTEGIRLGLSSYNAIFGNNIENIEKGIALEYSSNNSITENNITNNIEGRWWPATGVYLSDSSSSMIYGNNIANDKYSVFVSLSSDNFIYHNNFVNNTNRVYTYNSVNVWDDGYPSGGNYWDDYVGADVKNGSGQDLPGSDGLGDTPYIIDENNKDSYPLMQPFHGPVRNLDTGQSYLTIQEAINNASEGDTIFALSGTYYEHVVVNKDNLTLIGENKSTTIIDGNGTGTVVYITASNVLMSEFTVLHGSFGIHLYYCGNNTIRDNMISNNYCDIYLQNSSLNTIANNAISISSIGLEGSLYSSNNTIRGNIFFDNSDGIDLYFYSDANFIYGNTVSNCDVGLRLGYANDNIIDNNNITSNRFVGVYLASYSYRNKIKRNTIANNNRGINHLYSENNTIYHNNFVNNTQLPEANTYAANVWDDGYPSGGNYWSDYDGVDLFSGRYQNMTGSDGKGDTPYSIDVNNVDHYPLMNPWTPATPGDINRDGKVDMKDVAIAAMAFGSYAGHPRWNSIADENEDGKIDMRDIALVAKNFGKTYP